MHYFMELTNYVIKVILFCIKYLEILKLTHFTNSLSKLFEVAIEKSNSVITE
jgi:hypothetical protein